MDSPYAVGPDIHVIPMNAQLPGLGVLAINAFVLHAEEPVLVDTGSGDDEDFIDALASVIDPKAIRWIWLTHDDADHTGHIQQVFEAAPHARLLTHALCALRMSSWWALPLERVHAIRLGDRLPVGDRTLRAVRPPLFDNPMTFGLLDEATGALFSVDSFGAVLPEPTQDVGHVPPDALAGGMVAWSASDAPWAHLVDRDRFAAVLQGVRELGPTTILPSHLPAARGSSLDHLLDILAAVPDAEPAVAPSKEEFEQMVATMAPDRSRS